MKYLLVTHIAFHRAADGSAVVDDLWSHDLRATASAIGPLSVIAPQLPVDSSFRGWGPGRDELSERDGISFIGLPMQRRFDPVVALRTRLMLEAAVESADVIHSSNFFPPHLTLWHAHDYAVKRGKPTVFVVAEDFVDMLDWEWVRTAPSPFARFRRRRMLEQMDNGVRKRVGNASLALLHTPAAVRRYRLAANKAVAIRQSVHEAEEVIAASEFKARAEAVLAGDPLQIVTASRLMPLKGIEFLIRAIALLRTRGISVSASVYGEGNERACLQSLIEHLAVQDRVHLKGVVTPGAPVRNALKAGHLFAMPHLTTDFGRAFWDAMAAGLPVVAFRSAASEDTVRDGVDGLLTPNADFEGLANALQRFHKERSHLVRAMEAARQRALENTCSIWHGIRAGLIRELVQS
jgi:glycosyltransferase involved in cell wall biosynthesis